MRSKTAALISAVSVPSLLESRIHCGASGSAGRQDVRPAIINTLLSLPATDTTDITTIGSGAIVSETGTKINFPCAG